MGNRVGFGVLSIARLATVRTLQNTARSARKGRSRRRGGLDTPGLLACEDGREQPDGAAEVQEQRSIIWSLLTKLSGRLQQVIAMPYSLDDGTRMQNTQIARELGVTRERVPRCSRRQACARVFGIGKTSTSGDGLDFVS